MLNPVAIQAVARARQNDALRTINESRMARRVKQARNARPSLPERIANEAGSLLNRAGEHLNISPASPDTGARG